VSFREKLLALGNGEDSATKKNGCDSKRLDLHERRASADQLLVFFSDSFVHTQTSRDDVFQLPSVLALPEHTGTPRGRYVVPPDQSPMGVQLTGKVESSGFLHARDSTPAASD